VQSRLTTENSPLVWISGEVVATSFSPAEACATSARRHLTTEVSELLWPQRAIRGNCLPSSRGGPVHLRRSGHTASLRNRAAHVVDAKLRWRSGH
jgi:hypothetical protein